MTFEQLHAAVHRATHGRVDLEPGFAMAISLIGVTSRLWVEQAEETDRWNNRKLGVDLSEVVLAGSIGGKRLTYKQLVGVTQ